MIEKIQITIPQLVVGPTNNFSNINKEHFNDTRNHLPPNYLAAQFAKFFVSHSIVNQTLLSVHLNHRKKTNCRQQDVFYSIDADHHIEHRQIENVCHELHKLTEELLTLAFCTDYMIEFKDWPSQPTSDEIIGLFHLNPRLKVDLAPHRPLFNTLRIIQATSNHFSILPTPEVLILDDDPAILISDSIGPDSQGNTKMPLKKLIDSYNIFFTTIRAALKKIAPEGYGNFLEELPSGPYELKATIPQISATSGGMRFDDQNYMYHLYFSPNYGQLINKFTDYNDRHLFMNSLIQDIYLLHENEKPFMTDAPRYSLKGQRTNILFTTETLIYWIRKNIDDLIGLQYCLYVLQKDGNEPEELTISSIGSLLDKKVGIPLQPLFAEHISALKRINDISNTFKHSFVTSETHMLIGKDEPTINCLNLPWNKTKNTPVFHSYFLKDILNDYAAFFAYARSLVRGFQWPNRVDPTP
jgi:hypothetical protein